MYRRCFVVLSCLILLVTTEVFSQSLRPIEQIDRVTREMEMLLSRNILDTIPLGQSFGMNRTLRRIYDKQPSDSASISEKKLKEMLTGGAFSAQVDISLGWAEDPSRNFQGNGLAYIDAVISPLSQGRGGRRIDEGFSMVAEPSMGFAVGAWDFYKTVAVPIAKGQSSSQSIGIKEIWGEGPVGPLYMSVGRRPNVWGPSLKNGSLFSGQARGLDQITVGSDGTFRLPWILEKIGPTRLSVSLSRLEKDRNIPNSYLVGYRLNVKPWRSLEVGLLALVHSGGEGSPSASVWSRVLDHLIVVEPLTRLGTPERQRLAISNRFAGFDFRWRLPWETAPQMYGSLVFDDLGKPDQLDRVFGQDASYIVGMFVPHILGNDSQYMRFEYRETGIRFYEHDPFRSGLTVDEMIIGDNLGPNGRGGHLEFGKNFGVSSQFNLELAWEERSLDQYRVKEGFTFEKGMDKPEEIRFRIVGSWEEEMDLGPIVLGRIGYEKVSNFSAYEGASHNNWLIEVRTIVPLAP